MQIKLLFFLLLLAAFANAQDLDVLHYRFEIGLSDTNDSINAEAEIKVVMKKAKPLLFDLKERSANGKGMLVTHVDINEHKTSSYCFTQQNDQLIIPILKGIPGDTFKVFIRYKGIPDDGLIISKNKFGDRTFFGDNWPNRAHHWLPCVDRPDDKASFEFLVTAPSQYSVISNGVKVEEKVLEKGKRFTHWKEDIALSTKVMVIGAARFSVRTYDDSPAGIPVSAWVYPQDSTKGFYDFALAPDILKFFTGYIGAFPYKKLANVQSTTIFGGMENASCIFYAENLVTGKRSFEETIAHEIAHQWFGDMASEKSFAHLWLSEGFATYLTNLYVEHKYGRERMVKRLQEEKDEVIEFAATANRAVVDSTKNLMSLLNANSYQKGGWVLHMLRNEVGDATFQKIVQAYYNRYKGSNADTKDFEAIAERVSGKELSWFFDQWLYRPGIPVLQVFTKVQNGELTLFVKQLGTPYQLTLSAEITLEDNAVVRKSFDLKNVNHVFKIPGKSRSVTFTPDPEAQLLFRQKK